MILLSVDKREQPRLVLFCARRHAAEFGSAATERGRPLSSAVCPRVVRLGLLAADAATLSPDLYVE